MQNQDNGTVYALAVLDNNLLVAGHYNGNITLSSQQNDGTYLHQQTLQFPDNNEQKHPVWVTDLAKLPNNRLVASHFDGTLNLWDLNAEEKEGEKKPEHCFQNFQEAPSTISSLAVLENGNVIAVGSWDGIIKFYNTQNKGRISVPLPNKTQSIYGTTRIVHYHIRNKEISQRVEETNYSSINALEVFSLYNNSTKEILAAGDYTGNIIIYWKGDDYKGHITHNAHSYEILSLTTITSRRALVSGDKNGHIKLWTYNNNNSNIQCIQQIQPLKTRKPVHRLTVIANQTLIAIYDNTVIQQWHIEENKLAIKDTSSIDWRAYALTSREEKNQPTYLVIGGNSQPFQTDKKTGLNNKGITQTWSYNKDKQKFEFDQQQPIADLDESLNLDQIQNIQKFKEKVFPHLPAHTIISNHQGQKQTQETDALKCLNKIKCLDDQKYQDNKEENKNTLLHYAAFYDILKVIQKNKADNFTTWDNRNSWELSATHIAIICSHQKFVEELLCQSHQCYAPIQINIHNQTISLEILQLAIVTGHQHIVKKILDQNSIIWLNHLQRIENIGNILHLAVLSSQNSMLNFLLTNENIKNITSIFLLCNEFNNQSQTPLDLAAYLGNITAINLLRPYTHLRFKGNNQQKSPLHWAVEGFQPKAIQLLTEATPTWILDQINSQNENQQTPLQLALQLLSENIVNPTQKKILEHIYIILMNARGTHDLIQINEQTTLFSHTEKLRHVKNLVFRGGSIKGIAYGGALQQLDKDFNTELEQENSLLHIERVGGTSIGAFTAMLLAIGYNPDEITRALLALFDKLKTIIHDEYLAIPNMDQLNVLDYFKGTWDILVASYGKHSEAPWWHYIIPFMPIADLTGLINGTAIQKYIDDLIARKISLHNPQQAKNLTFGDLNDKVQQNDPPLNYRYKHLYVVASQLCPNQNITIFNSEDKKYEDVFISDAVYASMNFPGLLKPCTVRKKTNGGESVEFIPNARYIDGGLAYNYPIGLFDFKKFTRPYLINQTDEPEINHETLGLTLITSDPHASNPPPSFPEVKLNGITETAEKIMTFYNDAEELITATSKIGYDRTIEINTHGITTFDYSIFKDPKPENPRVKVLTTVGENAVTRYFKPNEELKEIPSLEEQKPDGCCNCCTIS